MGGDELFADCEPEAICQCFDSTSHAFNLDMVIIPELTIVVGCLMQIDFWFAANRLRLCPDALSAIRCHLPEFFYGYVSHFGIAYYMCQNKNRLSNNADVISYTFCITKMSGIIYQHFKFFCRILYNVVEHNHIINDYGGVSHEQ